MMEQNTTNKPLRRVGTLTLGVGAEKFRGVFDNTEIYHKLAELTGVQ